MTGCADRVPVERLLVGDKVRAVLDGPLGTVERTCEQGFGGWMAVAYPNPRNRWDGEPTVSLPYKRGDRLYLVEQAS